MPVTTSETFVTSGANGQPLHGTRWKPDSTKPTTKALLIAPAMATPATFYTPIVGWLNEQGWTVYTFDYQGHAASMLPGTTLADTDADMLTWGEDLRLMVEYVAGQEQSETRLHYLAHSLGGQLLPLVDTSRLDAATIVASGSGFWGHSNSKNLLLAPLLWYVIAPFTTARTGYFPGRKLKILGDVPSKVMRQWSAWCKRKNYMFSEFPELADRFAEVKVTVRSVSFSDDRTMPGRATKALESWYPQDLMQAHRYEPAELGVAKIDHMGIFRPDAAELWPRVFAHLAVA
ncbi:alpha/beta hydrolase family protein [Micrococcoides hystricis]|uniref:Alpha/beta fold hydrolase n=1 Tax=Micrococcoides hystricis TaxID=1572761 RepID=A0ABV6PA09_9MICC